MISLRLLTTADATDLAPRLRQADKDETICLGSNPREALLMGAFDNIFSASRGRAYALVDNDIVIAAIGFTSAGTLWALSTKFTRSQRWELFLRTGEILDYLHKEAKAKRAFIDGCPYFHNLIHTRNRTAIRWMEKTNLFLIDKHNPVEVGKEVFYNFRTKMAHELTAPRLGGMIVLERAEAACVPH